MRKRYAVAFVVLLFFSFAATSGGAESDRRPVTAEDVWSIKRCGSLAVSPDGEDVALVVTEYDIEDNSENGDIDLDSLRAEVKRRKESKVTAKITENRFYRHWDTWLTDGYYPHFYLLDLETEEGRVGSSRRKKEPGE